MQFCTVGVRMLPLFMHKIRRTKNRYQTTRTENHSNRTRRWNVIADVISTAIFPVPDEGVSANFAVGQFFIILWRRGAVFFWRE